MNVKFDTLREIKRIEDEDGVLIWTNKRLFHSGAGFDRTEIQGIIYKLVNVPAIFPAAPDTHIREYLYQGPLLCDTEEKVLKDTIDHYMKNIKNGSRTKIQSRGED